MGRRRSCFSCGVLQTGSGAFCSACGKPLDAPDLELIAGDTTSDAGSDVVLSSGSSRGRSMLAIGVVLAALVGVAAFSGAGKTSTTSPTSTATTSAASATTITPSTSRTAPTESTQKRSTDPRPVTATLPSSLTIARGSDSPVALPPAPGEPVPLLLGETTGAKILLVGQYSSGATDTILDIDTGTMTSLDSSTFPGGGSSRLQTTATGVVLNGSGGFNVQFFTADGAVKQYRRAGLGSEGEGVVIGDVLWTTQIEANGRRRLASIDLQTGAAVAWVDMSFGTFLVGQDENGRPMVQASAVSATYAFDTATKQFDLVSAAAIIGSNGQQRIEVVCDEHLACRFVLRGPRDGIRDGTVTDLAEFSANSGASLSPSGENVLIVTYSPLASSFDVVNVATREKTHLLDRSFANGEIPWGWSVDGRWLFFLNDNKLWAWRSGLPAPIEVLVGGKSVQATALGVFPPR